jgi:hypothetical protein
MDVKNSDQNVNGDKGVEGSGDTEQKKVEENKTEEIKTIEISKYNELKAQHDALSLSLSELKKLDPEKLQERLQNMELEVTRYKRSEALLSIGLQKDSEVAKYAEIMYDASEAKKTGDSFEKWLKEVAEKDSVIKFAISAGAGNKQVEGNQVTTGRKVGKDDKPPAGDVEITEDVIRRMSHAEYAEYRKNRSRKNR